MGKSVSSAADANRDFPTAPRGSRGRLRRHHQPRQAGREDHPVRHDGSRPGAAKKRLMARLRAQPAINIGRWTRDELYERD